MDSDFYEVLGVQRSASQSDIRRAYRRLALRFHPDRNQSSEAAAEDRFIQTQRAYETLGDPARRAEYDRRTSPQPEQDLQKAADVAAATARREYELANAARVILQAEYEVAKEAAGAPLSAAADAEVAMFDAQDEYESARKAGAFAERKYDAYVRAVNEYAAACRVHDAAEDKATQMWEKYEGAARIMMAAYRKHVAAAAKSKKVRDKHAAARTREPDPHSAADLATTTAREIYETADNMAAVAWWEMEEYKRRRDDGEMQFMRLHKLIHRFTSADRAAAVAKENWKAAQSVAKGVRRKHNATFGSEPKPASPTVSESKPDLGLRFAKIAGLVILGGILLDLIRMCG